MSRELDARLVRETYRLGGSVKAATAGAALLILACVVMAALAGTTAPLWLRLGAMISMLSLAFGLLVHARRGETLVRVARDGVHVRATGEAVFLPWSAIASVRMHDKPHLQLALTLRSNKTLSAIVGHPRDARRVVERIQAYVNAYEENELDAHPVCRGREPVSAWVKRLRGIGSGAGATHRAVPFRADAFWRIVESTSATASHRAAAAIAIASSGEHDAERLRMVADTTASPVLESTLVRLAEREADDDALERALAELDKPHGLLSESRVAHALRHSRP